MASRNSFYEQFLNDLAEQMALYPSELDNPAMVRQLQGRYQPLPMGENAAQKAGRHEDGSYSLPNGMVRDAETRAIRPPIRPHGGGGGLLHSLGRAVRSYPDVSKSIGNYIWKDPEYRNGEQVPYSGMGFNSVAKELIDPAFLLSMAIPGPKGSRASHGAEVRAELLAKRAAHGPRKPGGGRRPKEPTPQYPPKNNADLVDMLAKSLPPAAPMKYTPKAGGGLKALLGKLRRADR